MNKPLVVLVGILFMFSTQFVEAKDEKPLNELTQEFDFENLPDEEVKKISEAPKAKKETQKLSARQEDVNSGYLKNEFAHAQLNSTRLFIGLLCLLSISSLLIVLIFLRKTNHSASDIVNAAGLNLIIFGTIILVLVVDTTEQLTSAIGVLGAIAGYLFGTIQRKEAKG